MSVTEEVAARACDLDGEALTLELLHENERLLARNRELRRQNDVGFRLNLVLWIAFVVALIF